jgi:hypothetical protein
MAEFFENMAPRQMLEKARREFQKLQNEPNSDNISNFFVTAYHIRDSVIKSTIISSIDINNLLSNPDFRRCRYICNKCKHVVLDSGDNEFITYRRPGAFLGEITLDESRLGMGRAYYIIDSSEQIDVLELARRIIDLWENFFSQHDI